MPLCLVRVHGILTISVFSNPKEGQGNHWHPKIETTRQSRLRASQETTAGSRVRRIRRLHSRRETASVYAVRCHPNRHTWFRRAFYRHQYRVTDCAGSRCHPKDYGESLAGASGPSHLWSICCHQTPVSGCPADLVASYETADAPSIPQMSLFPTPA